MCNTAELATETVLSTSKNNTSYQPFNNEQTFLPKPYETSLYDDT